MSKVVILNRNLKLTIKQEKLKLRITTVYKYKLFKLKSNYSIIVKNTPSTSSSNIVNVRISIYPSKMRYNE